jgi:hypothetical protein
MKKMCAGLAAVLAAGAALAQPMKPEETEVWKPEPRRVMPGAAGAAPSDALVLFDGKDLREWVQTNAPDKPAEWVVAGEYARILTPLFFWNFVSMSLGGVLVIAERTDVSLVWQIVTLALTVVAMFVGTRVLNDIVASLWCFSLARAASYILYMALSYYHAERPRAGTASA